jgi:hypothetical protein
VGVHGPGASFTHPLVRTYAKRQTGEKERVGGGIVGESGVVGDLLQLVIASNNAHA